MKTLPKLPLSTADHGRLMALVQPLVDAARVEMPDGTPLWCPDAAGHYRGAWLRDFCYLVEGASGLVSAGDVLRIIDLFLRHQAEDGSVPTRVMADGVPDFREGPREDPIGSGPPVDNPSFLAKLLCAYVDLSGDWQALVDRLDAVAQALDSLPIDRHGLVVIDQNLPRSGYGFTDCVSKTGKELFSSLLRWEALRRLAETCRRWELHDDAHFWYELAVPVHGALSQFYDPKRHLFMAASGDCRQADIWGSAYACVIGAATGGQVSEVAAWLRGNLDAWHWKGHVRHLPAGEYWERFLRPVQPDHYQNGGYWAVPTGWVAQVIAVEDTSLARRVVLEALEEFEQYGVMEWIHPEHGRHTPGYLASVCNVLGAVIPSRRVAAGYG